MNSHSFSSFTKTLSFHELEHSLSIEGNNPHSVKNIGWAICEASDRLIKFQLG